MLRDQLTFSHNLLQDIKIVFLSSSTQRRQLGLGNQLQKLRGKETERVKWEKIGLYHSLCVITSGSD